MYFIKFQLFFLEVDILFLSLALFRIICIIYRYVKFLSEKHGGVRYMQLWVLLSSKWNKIIWINNDDTETSIQPNDAPKAEGNFMEY